MSPVDNTLDYMDHAAFLDFRAVGHAPLIQCTWIYDNDIDLDVLRRFHRNLGQGLLGRRIERSPLPFGRPRWVDWPGPADIDVATETRPAGEVAEWAEQQVAVPIDPEIGPPWRLAVQPLTGGGAAVTLVVAHTVVDGVGLSNAITAAVKGVVSEVRYPATRSRTKWQAILADLWVTMRDLPHVATGLFRAPRAARDAPRYMRARAEVTSVAGSRSSGEGPVLRAGNIVMDRRVVVPAVTARIDIRDWDDRAAELGGTPNSLFLGFTSRLLDVLGWMDPDGLANLKIPVNERFPGDTRGNALTGIAVTVDPTDVTTDLREVRAGLKTALSTLAENENVLKAPLPLTPFVPTFVARRMDLVVARSAAITCSNLGDLDPAVNRPAGTDANWFAIRATRMPGQVTLADLQRTRGICFPVVSGRLDGCLFITASYIDAYGSTTTGELALTVRGVLDEFGLSGIVE